MDHDTPRGRPPASDGARTRARILRVARRVFAELGYEGTTNRKLADEIGVTSAAVYHYFDSKLDLYAAVYADVREVIDASADVALAGCDGTFYGRLDALLSSFHRLNTMDPSVARFLKATRIDRERHTDIDETLRVRAPRRDFAAELCDRGEAEGWMAPARRDEMYGLLRVVLVGLSDGVSDDLRQQRAAIAGVLAVFRGEFRAPTLGVTAADSA